MSFSNININIMKNSFEKYEYNDEICLRYNIFVLELIKAYDKSNDKEWLNFAEYLIDKILEFIDLPEYMINKLQIIKRKRKLSQYEKEELYDIREKEKDIMIQCGIAILLENQSDFERFFARLDDKDTFKKFPIYNLIK